MIHFQDVTKSYGDTVVLKNVSLTINEGEFVSLVGPSGAGKTTLIEGILGNLRLDSGKIIVNKIEIGNLKSKELQRYRRTIGVIFQDYLLLPNKTVEENVAFAMEVCGEEDFETHARVKEVLELVDMTRNAHKFPSQLSGGERQRTAIARALVHNPRIIIADEPTGNLDPHQSEEILRLLQRINEYGVTVILATHDKALVNMLARRVVALSSGVIVSDWKQGKYDEEIIVINDVPGGIEIIEVS